MLPFFLPFLLAAFAAGDVVHQALDDHIEEVDQWDEHNKLPPVRWMVSQCRGNQDGGFVLRKGTLVITVVVDGHGTKRKKDAAFATEVAKDVAYHLAQKGAQPTDAFLQSESKAVIRIVNDHIDNTKRRESWGCAALVCVCDVESGEKASINFGDCELCIVDKDEPRTCKKVEFPEVDLWKLQQVYQRNGYTLVQGYNQGWRYGLRYGTTAGLSSENPVPEGTIDELLWAHPLFLGDVPSKLSEDIADEGLFLTFSCVLAPNEGLVGGSDGMSSGRDAPSEITDWVKSKSPCPFYHDKWEVENSYQNIDDRFVFAVGFSPEDLARMFRVPESVVDLRISTANKLKTKAEEIRDALQELINNALFSIGIMEENVKYEEEHPTKQEDESSYWSDWLPGSHGYPRSIKSEGDDEEEDEYPSENLPKTLQELKKKLEELKGKMEEQEVKLQERRRMVEILEREKAKLSV